MRFSVAIALASFVLAVLTRDGWMMATFAIFALASLLDEQSERARRKKDRQVVIVVHETPPASGNAWTVHQDAWTMHGDSP